MNGKNGVPRIVCYRRASAPTFYPKTRVCKEVRRKSLNLLSQTPGSLDCVSSVELP